MLAVRDRAIDGTGLSPTRFAALPAATGLSPPILCQLAWRTPVRVIFDRSDRSYSLIDVRFAPKATWSLRVRNMSRWASYGLMRRSKERRSLKSSMRFLRDLGIWRTSGRLSERNILRIASTVGQLRRSGRGPMRYCRQDQRDQNLGNRRSC